MAIKLPSNLHRNRHGVLYFRIGVPQDLRHHFATAEIYKSLRTANVRAAALDAQTLSSAFKHLFHQIRQYLYMSDENGAPEPPVIDPRLGDLIRYTKQKLRLQEQIDRQADELIEGHRQRIKLIAQHERELALVLKAKGARGTAQPIGDGRNISGYIKPYIESVRSRRKPPADQTITSYEISARLFVEIIGDKPLHELSHKDRNRYDETIFKVPKHRQKMPATKGKSLAEILTIPGLELMSPSTVKDEALRANLFLAWVFHQEGKDVPFKLLEKFKVEKSDVRQRRPFTDPELQLLFNAATLGKDRYPSPYKYWLPLIALHSGARQDEVAQLGLSEITLVDGVHCFNITPTLDPDEKPIERTLGKHVKTDAGKRIVPIHSRLIELGLIDYIEGLKRRGHEMLFPDLAHAQTKYGALVSKWFARYCDELGLSDRDLTFHSIRHNVITLLTKKDIQIELRMVLVGHSQGKSGVHFDYIHLEGMFSSSDKQLAIEALRFEHCIDYHALKANAPTLADLEHAVARNAKRK